MPQVIYSMLRKAQGPVIVQVWRLSFDAGPLYPSSHRECRRKAVMKTAESAKLCFCLERILHAYLGG
jgi:hypothetical protein